MSAHGASGASTTSGEVLRRNLSGQVRAEEILLASVAEPRHAYLFLGPAGSGRRDAALAFAAALVCDEGGCGECARCRAVAEGHHPDVFLIERAGASISVEQVRSIVARAQRSPRAGRRQVLILVDLHLAEHAAPALLKTLEEPPDTTVFIVLAEPVGRSLETIASRCVLVPFMPLRRGELQRVLEEDGVATEVAAEAATRAGGRLDRARLLAGDPRLLRREELWRSVPERLDGTGATVVSLAKELLGSSEEVLVVLRERQKSELETAKGAAEAAGERGLPGRAAIEDRHRRQERRARTDELRAGLGILGGVFRLRLSVPGASSQKLKAAGEAFAAVEHAAAMLIRNPNELLLLEALLVRIDRAG